MNDVGLKILNELIDCYKEQDEITKTEAIKQIAKHHGVSEDAIWRYLRKSRAVDKWSLSALRYHLAEKKGLMVRAS